MTFRGSCILYPDHASKELNCIFIRCHNFPYRFNSENCTIWYTKSMVKSCETIWKVIFMHDVLHCQTMRCMPLKTSNFLDSFALFRRYTPIYATLMPKCAKRRNALFYWQNSRDIISLRQAIPLFLSFY